VALRSANRTSVLPPTFTLGGNILSELLHVPNLSSNLSNHARTLNILWRTI
jgi:hypothetical protein